MTFAWPLALLGLLAVPIGVVVYAIARRRPARFTVAFPNLHVLASVAGTPSKRRAISGALFTVSAIAMVVALARPQARILVPREDATVVLVMDRSGSMSANDVLPSRLDAARASAKAFTRLVPRRFRLGVVAFSEVADVIRTPTTDQLAVSHALDTLEPEGGTAIGDALDAALRLIDRSGGNAADAGSLSAILLLSDGASTSGADPVTAARRARAAHVPVFTIALGGDSGPSSGIGGAPDVETLRAIANATGARSFAAPTATELKQIYRDLGSRLGFEWRREEITAAFAVTAAVMLVASVASALRRRAALP